MQNYKQNNPARSTNIVLSYLLLAGDIIGVRLWTVMLLPFIEVCGCQSSIRSVVASTGRIYTVDYFGCDYFVD